MVRAVYIDVTTDSDSNTCSQVYFAVVHMHLQPYVKAIHMYRYLGGFLL